MLDPNKCDAELGHRVEAHLRALGLHTPTTPRLAERTEEERIASITRYMTLIMEELGLDLSDDSLRETPKRIAKMYSRELMWGLHPENFPKLTAIDNKMQYNEMLIERNISVMSLCEHHLVTIEGRCHVAYIPKDNVAGLSKFNRVVEYFARRPQVQERLVAQIFETLKMLLGTEDVAVVLNAKHYCVISRGVEDENSDTFTSKLGGVFLQTPVRAELMSLIRMPTL